MCVVHFILYDDIHCLDTIPFVRPAEKQFHSRSHSSLDVSERVSDVSGKMIFALVSKLSLIVSQVLAVLGEADVC